MLTAALPVALFLGLRLTSAAARDSNAMWFTQPFGYARHHPVVPTPRQVPHWLTRSVALCPACPVRLQTLTS
jgi:hypothetical protein